MHNKKVRQRLVLMFCLLVFCCMSASAQVEMTQIHPSMKAAVPQMQMQSMGKTLRARAVKKMPAFDLKRLLAEDEAKADSFGTRPVRYGKPFEVSYSLKDGEWNDVEKGRLWSMTFESDGARSLNFLLEKVYLPDSAYIFIVNEEETALYGNITSAVVNKTGIVLTDLIPGSKATIYLFEPTRNKGRSRMEITRVIHGIRDVATDGSLPGSSDGELAQLSSTCNIDVACKPAYRDEANAVGVIMTDWGFHFGSGALVMTADKSFEPYFLTAFHNLDWNDDYYIGIDERNAVQNWAFKFKYRKTTCSGTVLDTSITFSGADFVSAWNQTDFCLLKLKGRVKDVPTMYYLGWDNTGTIPTSGTCIHHPRGDVMKISIEQDPFTSVKWNSQSSSKNHWEVVFDEGITEPGSSGSPILNQSRRVVGQLHGGTHHDDPCLDITKDFGKFSLSWLGGGTPTSQLKCWLDPEDTGATTTNGSYAPGISATIEGDPIVCSSNVYILRGVPAEYNITWSLSNSSNFMMMFDGDFENDSTCYIGYINDTETTATLTARVYYGSILIKTVTMQLYHHTGVSLSGNQHVGYASGHYYPARDSIVYVTDNTTGVSGYEISPYSDVTLYSDAFRGMELGYYGTTPLTWEHYDHILKFSVPYQSSSPYSFHITGQSSGHCSDFDIPMRVDPTETEKIEGGLTAYFVPPNIIIHLGYESVVGTPVLPPVDTWYLEARRLGSSIVTYSTTVTGENAVIPMSTFLSGYYYVFTGLVLGDTFTCTVLMP